VTSTKTRRGASVFAKLATIMMVMAVFLMFITTLFFVALVQPAVHAGIDLGKAHAILLTSSLIVVFGVVLLTQRVLQHLLRPLRELNDGVTRLGEGELSVNIQRTTSDEFGTLTDAFNQMAARVREMVASRDQLLVDVSHELRSPLTRLKVALELMPDDGQRLRLSREVAEMERMITGLLELERLRAGRGVTLVRQDIVPIIRDVTATFEGQPPGVDLAVDGAREVVLDVDAEQLRTVLRNLIENAVKYSLPDSRAIRVSVSSNGSGATVHVADNGVGIPHEDAARIFEPFFRVDRSRSKESGGYGLGLSICKRVMEAHGGQVTVERTNGRGAAFVLTLPQATRR